MDHFISAIILAAGQGLRMGKQKLLLELEGRTIIERVVDTVLASKVNESIVVLGYQAGKMAEVLGERPVKPVFNRDYRLGQSTSLIAGIKAGDPRAGALMVVLADQPLLTVSLINQLIDFYNNSKYLIVRPFLGENPGHPVLMNTCLVPELLELKEDIGAREIIALHGEEVGLLQLDSREELLDIDTPDDYIKVKQKFKEDKQ